MTDIVTVYTVEKCYEYDLRAIVTAWNVEVQEAPDATANDA